MSPLCLCLLGAAPSTALTADSTVLEILEFQAVGLVIVLGALSLLALVCAGIGAVFQRVERAAPRGVNSAVSGSAVPPSAPVPAEVPVVVIAAAVAAVVQRPHRVVRVAPAGVGWSMEGRRQQLTSHQLRK